MQIARSVLAVILGLLAGSVINMAIVKFGHSIMPIPGLDPNNMDSLVKIMPTLGLKYFIFPFLAHALGTLSGALIAYLISAQYKKISAMIIGFGFLLGGIAASFMIPAPKEFIIVDLVLAYLPMAWLGAKIGNALKTENKAADI